MTRSPLWPVPISDDDVETKRSRVVLDIIVGSYSGPSALRSRSLRSPGAVVACAMFSNIACDGLVVNCRRDVFRLLLALLARRDRVITHEELVDHLFGDREDGGPTSSVMQVLMVQARAAAVTIGFRIDNWHGVGFVARQCADAAPALQAAE